MRRTNVDLCEYRSTIFDEIFRRIIPHDVERSRAQCSVLVSTCVLVFKINMDVLIIAEFYAYVFQGFIIACSNSLLTYAIITSKSLRCSYTIIVWEIFVDALMGASQMIAGIARLTTYYANIQQLRSRQYCMLMPWNIIGIWAEPMAAISLLMVSLDRLFALIMPVTYYKRSTLLQNIQIIAWNLMMCSIALVSWCFSVVDTEQNLSPFCWTSDSMLPVFNSMTLIITITASVSSVILYVIVFGISRKHANRLRGIQQDQQRHGSTFERQQRQLTITMGISCAFTLILYVLPVCVKFVLADELEMEISATVQAYATISCNLTPLTNITIVVLRHHEIRRRLVDVLPFSIEKNFFKVSNAPTIATTNFGARSTAGKCTT